MVHKKEMRFNCESFILKHGSVDIVPNSAMRNLNAAYYRFYLSLVVYFRLH